MKFVKQLACLFTASVLLISLFALPAAAAAAVSATPIQSSVRVNGVNKAFEAYCIGGSNYFRLRDIAFTLNGTAKQFQVNNIANSQNELTSHTPYTPVGGELEVTNTSRTVAAALNASYNVTLDGSKLDMTAYIIGAYNYVRLRDIAAAIGFGVRYVPETNAIEIDTSVGYTPDKSAAGTSSAPSGTAPSDREVTFIGDSIGIGVAPYLKKYYPDMVVDAKVSRQFYEAKGIIKSLMQSGKLASTVVIELGTNGTVKESDLRAVIDLLGSDRKIVFVNVQVPRSWCAGDNKTFAKVIPEFSNTVIADWYTASVNHSNYFASDKVHPSKTGATVLAKLIADAVEQIQ
jgi:hypothetical protein